MTCVARTSWLAASAALLLLGGCADMDRNHGRHGGMHHGMHQGGMHQGGMMAGKHDAAPPPAGDQNPVEPGTPQAGSHDHSAGTEPAGKAGDGMKMGDGDRKAMQDKCRRMKEAKAAHDHGNGPAGDKKDDKTGCPMRS